MKTATAIILFFAATMGAAHAQSCPGDMNGDGVTTIDEILKAVNAALDGCAIPPQPSVTPTATPLATATPRPACPFALDSRELVVTECDFVGRFCGDGPEVLIRLGAASASHLVLKLESATLPVLSLLSFTAYTSADITTAMLTDGGSVTLSSDGITLGFHPGSRVLTNDACPFADVVATFTDTVQR